MKLWNQLVSWVASFSMSPAPSSSTMVVTPLYRGRGTHYVEMWVGSPPQRQTAMVDTGSDLTAFPCMVEETEEQIPHHTDAPFNGSASETFSRVECADCVVGHCFGGLHHHIHHPTKDKAKSALTSPLSSKRKRTENGDDEEGDDEGIPHDAELPETSPAPTTSPTRVCELSESYEDRSSWHAYEATDLITLSSTSSNFSSFSSSIIEEKEGKRKGSRIHFGCQKSVGGKFLTQTADGILGMNNERHSYWRQLFHNKDSVGKGSSGGIIEESFDLCFRPEDDDRSPKTNDTIDHDEKYAGYMALGGSGESEAKYEYAALYPGMFYGVVLEDVYLKNDTTSVSLRHRRTTTSPIKDEYTHVSVNAIVDSGSTYTYLGGWKEELERSFLAMTGGRISYRGWGDDDFVLMPSLVLQLRGASSSGNHREASSVNITIPPRRYAFAAGKASVIATSTPSSGGGGIEELSNILGASTLQGHSVVFRVGEGRIGWAPSDCRPERLHPSRHQGADVKKGGSISSHQWWKKWVENNPKTSEIMLHFVLPVVVVVAVMVTLIAQHYRQQTRSQLSSTYRAAVMEDDQSNTDVNPTMVVTLREIA